MAILSSVVNPVFDPRRRRGLAMLTALPLMAAGGARADNVTRVYGANPVVTWLLAVLYPERLIGWNFPPAAQAQGFIEPAALELPVVGGFFGQGRMPNAESLLAQRPQLAVVSGATSVALKRSVEAMAALNIPTLTLELERVDEYPAAIRQLGGRLGEAGRMQRAAQAAEHLLAIIRAFPDHGGPSVFYAEQHDGLATECRGSIHSEAIRLVNASNPHVCGEGEASQRFGMVRIDRETLLSYDPDWILTQSPAIYRGFFNQPAFSMLSAVQAGRVLLAPQAPFPWLDRPPSFMRLPGALWLFDRLHAGHGRFDLEAELQRFFGDFYGLRPTAAQMAAMLQPEERV